MIRKLVDFALNNRFVVIALALLCVFAGALEFHEMPVEAYPDISDNYVNDYQPMAGAFRGGGRAAGQHSHRNSDGRSPAPVGAALRVRFWPFVHDAGL